MDTRSSPWPALPTSRAVALVGAGPMSEPLTFYLAASALYLALDAAWPLLKYHLLERHVLAPAH